MSQRGVSLGVPSGSSAPTSDGLICHDSGITGATAYTCHL